MKTLIILLVILYSPSTLTGPSIQAANNQFDASQLIGLWQAGSPEIGAGLTDNFRFYKDGRFIFYYNSEDDTRIIQGFKGTYRVSGQSIYFTIKYKIVTQGAGIVTGGLGTDVNIFVFDDKGKTEIIPEKNSKELDQVHIREVKMAGNKIVSVKFNSQLFSKISEDPDKYNK